VDQTLWIRVTCSSCDQVVFDRAIDAQDREAAPLVHKARTAAAVHARCCADQVECEDLLNAA
jgi:hypothetical protein